MSRLTSSTHAEFVYERNGRFKPRPALRAEVPSIFLENRKMEGASARRPGSVVYTTPKKFAAINGHFEREKSHEFHDVIVFEKRRFQIDFRPH